MLITLQKNAIQQIVWAAGAQRVGSLAVKSWLVANRDETNQIRVGPSDNQRQIPDLTDPDTRAASLVDPLGSIQVGPGMDWYAVSPNAAVQVDIIPDCSYWAPSPAQVATQIALLGLMLDTTGQTISGHTSTTAANTANALTAGVPPGVPSISSVHKLFGVPAGSPYTMLTLPGAGRLWAVSISFAMSTDAAYAGGFASAASYVHLGSGAVLEITELNVSGPTQAGAAHGDIALNGLPVAAGDTIMLDVNGAVTITDAQMRCSANVLYSVP